MKTSFLGRESDAGDLHSSKTVLLESTVDRQIRRPVSAVLQQLWDASREPVGKTGSLTKLSDMRAFR
jgi:hypothetical protein